MSYAIGQQARVSAEFRDPANVLTDPTTVKLKVRAPTGPEQTFVFGSSSIVRDSLGKYHYDLALTSGGDWIVKWVSRGVLTTASPETPIRVDPTRFIRPL
jgi:hypothetical protein